MWRDTLTGALNVDAGLVFLVVAFNPAAKKQYRLAMRLADYQPTYFGLNRISDLPIALVLQGLAGTSQHGATRSL